MMQLQLNLNLNIAITKQHVQFNLIQLQYLGTQLTVERKTDLARTINYQTYNNSFRPDTVNYDFDRIWRVLQEKGIESAKTVSALVNILDQLTAADREIVEQLIAETRLNIQQDTGIAKLIDDEATKRIEQDKAYNLLHQIESGHLGNELKNYFNTVIATQTPNVFDGVGTSVVVDDLTGKTQAFINNEQSKKNQERISVKDFGAKGDGVTDDRASIQAAIDYAISIGGCEIYFPATNGTGYTVKTTHPKYPKSALVVDLTNAPGGVYSRGNISLIGNSYTSRITLNTTGSIEHLLYFPVRTNFMKIDGLWLNANKKADYAFHAQTEYHPYLSLYRSRFQGGIVASAKVATYVSRFVECFFELSLGNGLEVIAPTLGPNTSLLLESCYALNNKDIGYKFGYITYITLNACACDENDIGYQFASAYGVTMNGCGAERVRQPIQVLGYRGFVLNTFFMLSCGSSDAALPQEHLVEFKSGTNAVVSGIRIEGARNYKYLLGSTGSSFGFENITVLDDSVKRSQAIWVTTYNSERPIKFLRGDKSERSQTINVATVDDFRTAIRNYATDYEVNHEVIIQLTDGIYDLGLINSVINRVNGSGSLTVKGNSTDRSAVKFYTQYNRLQVNSSTAKVILKDLTISGATGNNSYDRLIVNESPNVILSNVLISKDGLNVGAGCKATNNSRVFIRNNTIVDSTSFSNKAWNWDSTSSFVIEQNSVKPTSGAWIEGMKIDFTNATNGYVSAVCTVSGMPGTWKNIGFVETATATTTQLTAIADPLNTTNKFAGKHVFNTTTNTLFYALGTTEVSAWKSMDSTTTITPV